VTAGEELRAAIVQLRSELLGRAISVIRHGPDAEDLVHDTVDRALTFETGYEPGTNARAWLHKILSNLILDRARRRRRGERALHELRDVEASWTHGDPAPEMLGLSPGVERALAELSASFRAPVLLIDLGDRSYLEAAAELQIPKGTVMSRLHRGRTALAARLEEEPLC
jgi:RNA polymerase sigma-70 factor (ECF subfamily)